MTAAEAAALTDLTFAIGKPLRRPAAAGRNAFGNRNLSIMRSWLPT